MPTPNRTPAGIVPYLADHALDGITEPAVVAEAHRTAREAAAAGKPPSKVYSAARQAARWGIRELFADAQREIGGEL